VKIINKFTFKKIRSMKPFLLAILTCCTLLASGQYKNDNVLFRTVSAEDLCAQLRSTPNAIVLDVRSKGEFEDTSQALNLNIGRLKSSIHLDIREMPVRWRELIEHKDKPVYVVCSHSQRSRRVSKMLTDSGFTNIINVNGGLTTLNLLPAAADCRAELHHTSVGYKLVSPLDLCSFLDLNRDVFILDVRSDSAYRGMASDERLNAQGRIRGALNIPLASVDANFNDIALSKKILVVDDYGNESPQAAAILRDKGYTNVFVLFNGMDMLLGRSQAEVPCAINRVQYSSAYKIVPPDELEALLKKEKDARIIDVRPADEFNNQSKQTGRNMGRLRNAISLPWAGMEKRAGELSAYKNKTIIIYHLGSSPDAYKAARYLADQGFTKVYLLPGGLSSLRWQAANLKGRSGLKDLVVDVPAENQ
jgi:rhodanese-related sulfurtransferase